MSLTLAIAANAIADIAMLGGLAYVMSRASRLTPHHAAQDNPRNLRPVTAPARAARPDLVLAA